MTKEKDWTGNRKSIYATLGASNHADHDRQQDDFYATDPKAIELLLQEETFSDPIWECACGAGHLAKVLNDRNFRVLATDLVDRGYGDGSVDFLQCEDTWDGDIITNPPYKYAKEFIEHALHLVHDGSKVAMFLKLQFLEGQGRKAFFLQNPPKTIYVSSSRIVCALNGEFEKVSSSAVAYAWYVWQKGFTGDPVVKWIN